MNSRILFSFLVFLLCLSTQVRADIAPNPMSGGISLEVPGGGETEIALLHNTVKLHVSPTLCKTRAFFRLRNTGTATELEVGFPLLYEGEAADFQVFINNVPSAFEEKVKDGKTPIGQPFKRRWKVWPMKFHVGQTHLVEVCYSSPPAESWTTVFDHSGYPSYWNWREAGWDYDLVKFGYSEPTPLREWLRIKEVQYILVTGSYWKGPIERCRVEANIENLATDSIVEIRPPAQSFSSKLITWEWKNVEPARNIVILFVGGVSPRQTIIPYLERIAAQHPQDEKIKETLKKMRQDFPNAEAIKARQKSFIEAKG